MKTLTFILGGARSGKSSYAQSLAVQRAGDDVLYVATLRETPDVANDEEMRTRILRHQQSRPATWRTVVVGDNPRDELLAAQKSMRLVIVDCLSLFVTHVLFRPEVEDLDAALRQMDVEKVAVDAVDGLLSAFKQGHQPWIVVSNEVGMGVVPAFASGRAFRDALGRVNQHVARLADEVYFVVAGLPQKLK